MSSHAGGFIHTHLATTVAYLLNTSVQRAQDIINGFRDIDDVDPETLAVVSDLIFTALHHEPASDEIQLSAFSYWQGGWQMLIPVART
ncbi:MAG: hypothetical protein HKN03_07895 [Acidimicrobiales bacterium]|nr:hypothetical protein [Acidimicrobiales bacterium]